MSFLGQLREKAHNRHIRKRLQNHHVTHSTVSFSQAKKIGILFEASDIENYGIVRKYAESYKSKGKQVKILGYINNKNPNTSVGFDFFSKKEINWMLKPKAHVVDQFINQEFDILINAYLEPVIPLLYISTFSKAQLRVGIYYPDHLNVADMMITINGEANLDNLFQEVEHYLNIFHHHE